MAIPPIATFDSGNFLVFHATAFSAWIIVGALGYRASTVPVKTDPATTFITLGYCPQPGSKTSGAASIALLVFLMAVFLIYLLCAAHQYTSRPGSRPGMAIATAIVLGFSSSTAFCIATHDKRPVSQHMFVVMGSMYAAGLLEQGVGLFTAFMRVLEPSERAYRAPY